MKLKNQLVNKELSIKLDKLEVKEDSLYWHKIPNKKCRNESVDEIVQFPMKSKWFDYYRAYTVAEIGEIMNLPQVSKVLERDFVEIPGIEEEQKDDWSGIFNPNFWAKHIIYLLKNNLIKL